MVVHHNGSHHGPNHADSDGNVSDSGHQTPEDSAGSDPESGEPTNDAEGLSNNPDFRKGVYDASHGSEMQSNDAAYTEGYDDFNKAQLPQTGEHHQQIGMATAMMMALAIVSMGLGKAADRRRHDA